MRESRPAKNNRTSRAATPLRKRTAVAAKRRPLSAAKKTKDVLAARQLLRSYEFVPHAIVGQPVTAVARRMGHWTFRGSDDLDVFTGTAFRFHGMPIAIKHYAGHPASTSTIYIDASVSDRRQIAETIDGVLSALGLPDEDVQWTRYSGRGNRARIEAAE
jgi:hypothetical protein